MIQNTIDRMSTTSSVIKGFTATVFAGLAAISFTAFTKGVIIAMLVPITCFIVVDVFYLQLERKYRYLYEQVLNLEHDVDFCMKPQKVNEIIKDDPKSNVRLQSCLRSVSIALFYYPIMATSLILLILH